MWEKSERGKRIFFIQRWKIPKIDSVLTLYDVIDADIHIGDVFDILVDIDYDVQEKLISFKCMIGTKICLKVKDLRGKVEDVGKEELNGGKFTTFDSRLRKK